MDKAIVLKVFDAKMEVPINVLKENFDQEEEDSNVV